MIFFYLHLFSNPVWLAHWREYSPLSLFLEQTFQLMKSDYHHYRTIDFNEYRDSFRDFLTSVYPSLFPHRGPVTISVSDIFLQLQFESRQDKTVSCKLYCSSCANVTQFTFLLPVIVHPFLLETNDHHHLTSSTFTVQDWLEYFISVKKHLYTSSHTCDCAQAL
jgi:hypothetical protein